MAIDDQDFVVLDDEDLSGYSVTSILPESLETIQEIQKWLQPTDFAGDSSDYKKHLNSYVVGTGNWIQRTDIYQKWYNSPKSSSLWIKAIPGAGKSVFAAMIADKLAHTEKVPVLYFFFRQIIAKNHDPQYLVRDWLSQLLPYNPDLQSRLKRQMKGHPGLDEISTDEFWLSLIQTIESIPKLYCVVDALDEMNISQLGFLDRLVDLGKQKHSTVKVLMTSRPLPRIESKLRTTSILEISTLQMRLQQDMVDKDIAIYVNYRLQEHNDMNLTSALRETIRNAICTKGQGSFLYARLMMDKLLDGTAQISSRAADLNQIMEKLPTSLEDMYNGMLLDHAARSGVSQQLQLTILQWVTHSVRPLRLLELAVMIDSLNDRTAKGKDTKALVRRACGPLLEILEDETVSVIHHSFTEFLIDSARLKRAPMETGNDYFPVLRPEDTHCLLALTCLKYLRSGIFDEWITGIQRESPVKPPGHRNIKMQHPFVDYAASNVCAHVAMLEASGITVFPALDDFMNLDNHDFVSWVELTWSSHRIENISPLHVAAYWGMVNYCHHLIQLGLDVNQLDAELRTPLTWASTRGNADLVDLLLQNGANADPADRVGLKPLHYAAKANYYVVVRLLLAAGVDPLTARTKDPPGRRCGNYRSLVGETALTYACTGGCLESVLEFVNYLSPGSLNGAFRCVVSAGIANIAIALLKHPNISVDPTEDDCGDPPLFSAAHSQNPAIIRALLEKGADPNRRSKFLPDVQSRTGRHLTRFQGQSREVGPTPLHALAGLENYAWHASQFSLDKEDILEECCKLLVDAGGDVNAVDGNGRRPLHNSRSPAITSILLEYGASATAMSNDGSTPLHLACENMAHENVIELLVGHNADINAKREVDGKTPLHVLLYHSYLPNLKNFLAHKPDLNVGDKGGNTPLHLAVQQYSSTHQRFTPHQNIIQVLLDAGADPNITNFNMETPIHMTGHMRFSAEFMPIMVRGGANLEARDNIGRTVLLRSLVGSTDKRTIRMLLDLGARVDARDDYGNSAPHILCQKMGAPEVLRLLVEAGADPKGVNHEGNTLLHEAVRARELSNHSALVRYLEMLLELGVPATQKNHTGATALHLACSSVGTTCNTDSWQILIDLLVGPKFNIGIDEGDHHGIRAIHLAATISEQIVSCLIEAGADPTLCTLDRQTPLQVACRARQTNVVGLLLELYLNQNLSRLIDWKDKRGRTALHDAARSGRPETVKLLLDAGADLNMKDVNGFTPLHVCAEFIAENVIWSSQPVPHNNDGSLKAVNVLLGDAQRPIAPGPFHRHTLPVRSMWQSIESEHDTVRIRESIRLLLARGADGCALSRGDCTPFYIALSLGCKVMVDELLPLTQKALEDKFDLRSKYAAGGGAPFAKEYLELRAKHSPAMLQDLINKGDESFEWNSLLRLDDERLFDELIKLEVDFFNKRTNREPFPVTLVSRGYATLLQKFGPQVSLYHNPTTQEELDNIRHVGFQPLLHIACRRELPNMDVIRVLVDKFGVDINARSVPPITGSGVNQPCLDGETALHVLATGEYWWQKEAAKFLLQRGADVEMKDREGATPLSLCVDSRYRRGLWSNAMADLILRNGANPNSFDNGGLTCLNKAGSNSEIVRKLIRYGADLSLGETPPLFSAIASHDVATVAALLESGGALNVRRTSDKDGLQQSTHPGPQVPVSEITPLYFAALRAHNVPGKREMALPILKLLLEKGADPYEVFGGQHTVIHSVFSSGGILEPFLELSALDLEHRDPRGRTLFLASCSSSSRYAMHTFGLLSISKELKTDKPSVTSILYAMGADITARDNQGANALHYLSRGDATYSRILKDAPSLIDQKDIHGNTPLHYALQNRAFWTIKTLLSAGADPLEPDSSGNTALHYLAVGQYGADGPQHIELFRKFLALGVSINAKNKAGETPLFRFVETGGCDSWSTVSLQSRDFTIFQEAGADFQARNNNRESLLHITARKVSAGLGLLVAPENEANVERFRALMELGLDPLAEDNNQRTPLDVAAACENEGILKLLKRGEEWRPAPKEDPKEG